MKNEAETTINKTKDGCVHGSTVDLRDGSCALPIKYGRFSDTVYRIANFGPPKTWNLISSPFSS